VSVQQEADGIAHHSRVLCREISRTKIYCLGGGTLSVKRLPPNTERQRRVFAARPLVLDVWHDGSPPLSAIEFTEITASPY
jgi:hypothetical protein